MLPDLDSIEILLRAVQLRSLAKAADTKHLSLSAASRRMSLLEHHFGTALLHRLPGGVSPTAAGEALVRHAQTILRNVEVMHADLADYSRGTVGRVRLYANTSAMSQDLPNQLALWSVSNPDIRVEVKEVRSGDIVEAVREGTADVGVVTSAPVADIDFLPYGSDPLSVVVPTNHPLRRRQVRFTELLDEEFVGLSDSTMITKAMRRFSEEAGRFLRLRVQVQSFAAVCRLVAAQQGIGILPRGSVEAFRQDMQLRLIDLTDDWAQRQMHVCYCSSAASAATRRFVDFLVSRH